MKKYILALACRLVDRFCPPEPGTKPVEYKKPSALDVDYDKLEQRPVRVYGIPGIGATS